MALDPQLAKQEAQAVVEAALKRVFPKNAEGMTPERSLELLAEAVAELVVVAVEHVCKNGEVDRETFRLFCVDEKPGEKG